MQGWVKRFQADPSSGKWGGEMSIYDGDVIQFNDKK